MSEHRRLPLWAGRTAALLGIVLVAFTLRQAVAAISPILGDIRVDIPISNIDVGLLGTLPLGQPVGESTPTSGSWLSDRDAPGAHRSTSSRLDRVRHPQPLRQRAAVHQYR
jgi:hypothetical protein